MNEILDNTSKKLSHLSLCAGYGGLDRAAKEVIPGINTIGFVEIEGYAIANLAKEMEDGILDPSPIFTDLKSFPFGKLRRKIFLLSAGFPCQPFSSSGKGLSTEDPRHLYPFIANGVSESRPVWVWFENVEGIITKKCKDGTPVLLYVLQDLEKRGYEPTWGIFSAEEVGAPHRRKRVFILAYDKSIGFEGRAAKDFLDGIRMQSPEDGIRSGERSETPGCGQGSGRTVSNSRMQGRRELPDIGGNPSLEEPERNGKERGTEPVADSNGKRQPESKRDIGESGRRSGLLCEEVADNQGLGCSENPDPNGSQQKESGPQSGCESKELAYPNCEGPQGHTWNVDGEEGPQIWEGRSITPSRFPAGQGPFQFEWEASRTIEPRVGRAINGYSDRRDRLRLLGNGVLPKTGVKALYCLHHRLMERLYDIDAE